MKACNLRKKRAKLQKQEKKAVNFIRLNTKWHSQKENPEMQESVRERLKQLELVTQNMQKFGIEPQEESLLMLVETVMES
jgi:hypothetical protein